MAKLYVKQFKGVNTDKLPMKLEKDELAFCLNMDLENDGSLSQRKGSELVETFTNNINLLIFNEIREGIIYKLMVIIEGSNLYLYDGTTINNITTTLETNNEQWGGAGYVSDFIFSNGLFTYRLYYDITSSAYKIETISYEYKNDGSSQVVDVAVGDVVYNNDGDSTNGLDLHYYQAKVTQTGIDLSLEDFTNTTNWEDLGLMPIVPACLNYEQFDNRIFCCGDSTENLYWSNQGDATKWDALDFIALGAKPTALKAVGEFLFVGTDRGLIKLSLTGDYTAPYELVWLTKDGILNNSLVEVSSGVVGCLTNTGRYLIFDQYTKDGSQINLQVGLPIRNMIMDIDDTQMQVARINNQVIYTCSINNEYILNTGTDNNVQFVLNNVLYGWTFYNLPIKTLQEFNGELYYTDYGGKLYKLSEGVYQDDGSEFETYLVTSIFDDDMPEMHKSFRKVFIVANAATKVTIRCYWNVFYNINFQDTRDDDQLIYASGATWGTSTWGEFIWGGVYAQVPQFRIDSTGKGLQLKITRTTENADIKIQDLVIEYYPAYQIGNIYT